MLTWGSITIGATPVQISTTTLKVAQLILQSAPGNTGVIKVGGASDIVVANTKPGIVLNFNTDAAKPGDSLTLDGDGVNSIDLSKLFFHGGHAADILMYCYRVA